MRARDSGSDGGGERVDAPREESRLQVEGWVICDDLGCLGCRVKSRVGRVLNSKWSSPARDARKAYYMDAASSSCTSPSRSCSKQRHTLSF